MKHLRRLLVCIVCFSGTARAQVYQPVYDNLVPVAPNAYQFLKYTEVPVSEYTGLPNISIPLYEIEEDGIKLPITLNYHSGGLRVSEEASWVGLGWDLSIGSIVQTINDCDDFGGPSYTKRRPDYVQSPIPSNYPYRYNYPNTTDGIGWTATTTINAPSTYHSYMIATDYYIPVNGNFTTRQLDLFTNQYFDSEPDLFRANFLGHSINFVLDWSTSQFVVLNKKGYTINRQSDSAWQITVPSGDQFFFEVLSTTTTGSTTTAAIMGSGTNSPLPSMKTWMLTRIVTRNKKQIALNYSRTAAYNSYPSYSEKFRQDSLTRIDTQNGMTTAFEATAYGTFGVKGVDKTWSTNNETYLYLSRISFPKGRVDFVTSSRNDLLGGQKLDSIAVSNSTQLVRSFKFNYSYFDTLMAPGNGFGYTDSVTFAPVKSKRLKLVSLRQADSGMYVFSYNGNPLPPKNSFAQDCWGYYNGVTSNTSLIPNPAKLKITTLSDNGDNHSASAYYTQSGILTAIQYPTGGKAVFDYELNTFNNYWVPDSASTTNALSHGNGVRLHAVTLSTNGSDQARKTVYSYCTGKALLPVTMYRDYPLYDMVGQTNDNQYVAVDVFDMQEINASGYFSSSSLGSGSGIGYDTVTRQDVSTTGATNGKTVTVYANHPDIASYSTANFSLLNVTLPAIKNWVYPQNGSVLTSLIYDSSNNLLKKTAHIYKNILSPIHYGARMFSYNNLNAMPTSLGNSYWVSWAQNMVGFYPIFDFETLDSASHDTTYFANGSLTDSAVYVYDAYNNISQVTKRRSDGSEINTYTHPYDAYYSGNAVCKSMVDSNCLTDVLRFQKFTTTTLGGDMRTAYQDFRIPHVHNGKFLIDTVLTYKNGIAYAYPGVSLPDTIAYVYDSTNGNVLTYYQDHVYKKLLWDYSKNYPIAQVTNTDTLSVAYTSFESDGAGGWTIGSSSRDSSSAVTRSKCFALSSNLSISSLVSSAAYAVSYWSNQASAYTISGTASGYPIKGRSVSINGTTWTYYEHRVTGVTSFTVTGSGKIDELRLYPVGAQMKTFSYSPLNGVTSICDINNRINYYTYDKAGRLKNIKDQDGNVIKTFDYHYQINR